MHIYRKLKFIHIERGFLKGMIITFDDRLNGIIAGWSNSKTMVIEFIRSVLQTGSILDQRNQLKEALDLEIWFPASRGAISTAGGSAIGRDYSYFMLLLPMNR